MTKEQKKAYRNARAAFQAAKDAMVLALDPETENYKFGSRAWKDVSRGCFRRALAYMTEVRQ